MTEPYRLKCPRGHAQVFRRTGGPASDDDRHWRCQTCGASYDTVTDAKTGAEVPA